MTTQTLLTAQDLIDQLMDARTRELELFTDLTDDQILGTRAHFLEPPIWELGHVGWSQELWILRRLDRSEPILPDGDAIYDPFGVSYKKRWDHAFPSRDATLNYVRTVLERCIERLAGRDPSDEERHVYQLAAHHEDMHAENLTTVRQTLGFARPVLSVVDPGPGIPDSSVIAGDTEVPAGPFLLGSPRQEAFVFDNEKWAHEVEVAPFRMAKTTVTNGEFRAFVEEGGYRTRKWWGKHGWEWRRREGAERPLFWTRDGGVREFDEEVALPPNHPVVHVSWFEAKAYCAWAGRRLPTEAEWEFAASGGAQKRRWPWGDEALSPEHANLDSARGGTVDVCALPAGDSPFGLRQMIGNVWEWTSDYLSPYPGFETDVYKEYSEPYFGKKPVLRGGGWTTRSRLIRTTWRNFFIRHRRNIVAGFRTCAQ